MKPLSVFLYGEAETVDRAIDHIARRSPLLSATYRNVDVVRAYTDGDTFGLNEVAGVFLATSCKMSEEALSLFDEDPSGETSVKLVVIGCAVPNRAPVEDGNPRLSHRCQISSRVASRDVGKYIFVEKNRVGRIAELTWREFEDSLFKTWLTLWSDK